MSLRNQEMALEHEIGSMIGERHRLIITERSHLGKTEVTIQFPEYGFNFSDFIDYIPGSVERFVDKAMESLQDHIENLASKPWGTSASGIAMELQERANITATELARQLEQAKYEADAKAYAAAKERELYYTANPPVMLVDTLKEDPWK